VPDTHPGPVLILTGPPGVGKTTAAALLADRFPRAVHLESDRFFSFIRTGFVKPWRPESQAQNELVMRLVGEAAAGYARAGYLTVVDGIVIPRWFLAPLHEILVAAGLQASYAVLRAPLGACAARIDEREGEGLADLGVIAQIWDQFSDLGEFERHAIDVAGRSSEQVAALLGQRLAAGQLAL
jgi:predicted kinase